MHAQRSCGGPAARSRSPQWPSLALDAWYLGALVLVVTDMTASTMQGMARVQSGQAPAWPLISDRSVRRGLRGQA